MEQSPPNDIKIEKSRSISFSNKTPPIPTSKVSYLQKLIFEEQNISLLKHKFLEYIASVEQSNVPKIQQQIVGCKRCQNLETNLKQSLQALGGCGDNEIMQLLVQTKIQLASSEFNNLSLQGQMFREQEKRKNLQTLLTSVQTQRDQLVESSMQVQPGQMTKLLQESRQSYAKFRASQASFQLPKSETLSENSSPTLQHNGNFRSPNLRTPQQVLSPQNSQLNCQSEPSAQQYKPNPGKGWANARQNKENQENNNNFGYNNDVNDLKFKINGHTKPRKQKLAPIRDVMEY